MSAGVCPDKTSKFLAPRSFKESRTLDEDLTLTTRILS